MSMKHLLNSCAVSSSLASREEDDAFAARRLLLGISERGSGGLFAVSLAVTGKKQF